MIKAFVNAKIYASFKPLKITDALIIKDGKIAELGSDKILNFGKIEIIDLHRSIVMPGFVDAHMHLDELGEYLNILDLRNVKSIKEMQEKLKTVQDKDWIIGHGWDQELFEEQRWPDRFDLDKIIKDKPVFLSRVCLHAAVLNTKALEILGLLNSDYSSEYLVRDDRGITGIVKEQAFEQARKNIKKDVQKYIIDGANEALKKGVTSVGFVSCNSETLKILDKLRAKLKIRVHVYVNPESLDVLKEFKNSEFLKINGIKLFIDGSLGARTAWLSSPYADAETSGNLVIDEHEYFRICRKMDQQNLQIATHAIGDRALDVVLDSYALLKNKHRIEHASIIRKDQILKIKDIGATIVTQPHFVITDFWVLDRVGKERAEQVYPFRTLIENNIPVAFSTDSPVEPIDPWQTVYSAVTRGEYEKIPLYKESGSQTLSLEESLYLYTKSAAKALLDDNIGSLELGKYADFIILNKDPFNVEASQLKNIKVKETYVAGEKIV
ncbi:MAG: amidohydrolase [Thermoplasmata archaeon]